ncbi:MAG: NADAR family protein [Nonlabens sp.]
MFWGHQQSQTVTKSCLSHWYKSDFVIDGISYSTAEQYMMAEKAKLFEDSDIYAQIVESNKPGKAKELGRQVKNFDQKKWEANRYKIVIDGNYQKFKQNSKLANFLINTQDRILVEASPVDHIWGIGLSQEDKSAYDPHFWNGLNLLGHALMETRDLLKNE